MRDLNSDRPGSTNASTTVDAGHFQLETELFNDSSFVSENTDAKKSRLP